MKRYLLIGLGIVAFLLLAAAIVPFLIPKDVYKARIETVASSALGREVALNGDVSLSVFPSISVGIDDVTVANPDGFSASHMIEAGRLKASVRWAPLLTKKVEIAQFSFVDASVSLERLADGRANWTIENHSADTQTPGTQEGGGFQAGIDKARLVNTSVSFTDAVTGQSFELDAFDLTASLRGMEAPLKASGNGILNDIAFRFDTNLETPQTVLAGAKSALNFNIRTDIADLSYEGTVTLGDVQALDGQFSYKVPDLAQLAALTGIAGTADLSVLGALTAEGHITGAVDNMTISFTRLQQEGRLLDLTYTGDVNIQQNIPALDGQLRLASRDLGLLMTRLGLSAPGLDIVESIDFAGQLSGTPAAISITDLTASHNGKLFTAKYTGSITTGADNEMRGHLEASSPKLRDLMASLEIDLPAGETLQSFGIKADLTGAGKRISLSALEFALDDLTATGNAGLDYGQARPLITAALDMDALDLTPFTGSQEKSVAETSGWSTTPLALDGLKLLNAELTLKVGTLRIDPVTLSDTDITATLRNGQLVTDIRRFGAFGGVWSGKFGLDTRQAAPQLSIDMTGESILFSDFLATFTGSSQLSGIGQLRVTADSNGNSMSDLVQGLSGQLSADLADGKIRGINFAQLRRSLDDARAALASGQFALALSPQAETDFSTFTSSLSLNKGVARIDRLNFLMPALGSLEATGMINLADQKMDISLLPKFDRDGTGDRGGLMVNNIDIPIRMSGPWLSPSFGLDTQALQLRLQQEVTDEIQSQLSDVIEDQLGDAASDILSGALGLPGSARPEEKEAGTAADDTASEIERPQESEVGDAEPNEEETSPEQSIEEQLEDKARDALSDLFSSDD